TPGRSAPATPRARASGSRCRRRGLASAARLAGPSPIARLSTAAGARAAVAAGVAGAGPHHAAAAAVALDRVLERVEERGLTRRRRLRLLGRAAVRVLRGEVGPHLGREDPGLFLLVD